MNKIIFAERITPVLEFKNEFWKIKSTIGNEYDIEVGEGIENPTVFQWDSFYFVVFENKGDIETTIGFYTGVHQNTLQLIPEFDVDIDLIITDHNEKEIIKNKLEKLENYE